MSGDDTAMRRVPRTAELYDEVHEWLDHEAMLLDRNRYSEWLSTLDPSLAYFAPTRSTLMRDGGSTASQTYGHFDETYGSIKFRVDRLSEASAWAENPASRTRRFVTNVRVLADGADDIDVHSYLLLLRNRGDDPHFDLISCVRADRLRRSEDRLLKLVSRRIILDQATLGTANLAVFL